MIKPTIEEIREYMAKREFYQITEAEAFFDHFESNGWMVGRNPMKNWEAAVRTWITNFRKWNHEHTRTSFQDRITDQARRAADRIAIVEQGNGKTVPFVIRAVK